MTGQFLEEHLQMLQCFSTWFLLLVSSDNPSATKALTPKKDRVSKKTAWRAACGHLHFLLLSFRWHKTRRAEGKGELAISGKTLRHLVKGRLLLGKWCCLSSCLIFSMVFTWLPSRELLLELERDTWEVTRLLTPWRSRSVISSDNSRPRLLALPCLPPQEGGGRSSRTMG